MQKLGWLWRANLATTMMVRKNYLASRRIEEEQLLAATTPLVNRSEMIA